MRIVFVVPMLAPYAIPRFKELAKIDGVEVHVIVEKAESSGRLGWKFEEIDGVTMHLIKKNYSHKFTKNNRVGNYTQNEEHIFSFGLRKIINNLAPDIVLVCNSSQILMLLGPRKYKLGVIVEDTLRADEGRKNINRLLKKILLNSADFYCAFSDDSVEFLKKYGINNNIIKTSWSIDNKEFTNLSIEQLNEFKNNKGINDKKVNFLIVANLIKLKGIIEFLNSWRQLPHNILNNTELYIAGEGPLKNEIDEIINNDNSCSNVHLLGHVPYNDIKKYLQAVDVFVLPTLEDLNSLSIFEALAAKRPLLISKYTGNCFLVNDSVNGFVFDPYCVDDTIYKITRFLDGTLDDMSKESNKISQLYTNEVVMKKFYNDLLSV